MEQKIQSLEGLIQLFTSPLYSSRYSIAKTTETCVACGKLSKYFTNCLARLEYESSGICEECQEWYLKKPSH